MKKLSDLGERKAIDMISKLVTSGEEVIGIGDDCAVFEIGSEYLLVTTDMIYEKTHIPKKMTPWQIGWFIVAINLSDIAAKGGKPLGVVLSLGLPSNKTDFFLKEIIKGADKCATMYSTSIVGGDTKENSDITICGTAFGTIYKDCFMGRKGAKPGDLVAVTGCLGKSGAGYYAIKNNLSEKLAKGLLEPVPRVLEGMKLSKEKIVTSSMDISDGLSSSLYQLMEVNNVGFEIELKNIPFSQELKILSEKHNLSLIDYGLHFGGDYELLVTIPPNKFDMACSTLENIDSGLTCIGHVTKNKEVVLVENGKKRVFENKGYEHFKGNVC